MGTTTSYCCDDKNKSTMPDQIDNGAFQKAPLKNGKTANSMKGGEELKREMEEVI